MSEFNDLQASIFPGMTVADEQLAGYDNENHCGCMTCVWAAMDSPSMWGRPVGAPFIVCPTCGNKRCPKATLHSNQCTSSNEPGQTGSYYGGDS